MNALTTAPTPEHLRHAVRRVQDAERSSRLAAQYQADYVRNKLTQGEPVDLNGPSKHHLCAAAKPRLKTTQQILQELARAQSNAIKAGTLRYVEPNPFGRTA